MKKPKKTKRETKKFPALDRKVNLKSRQHLLDFDYLHKLDDAAKEWLNRFVEEEVHANLKHKGEILNKTPADRKRIYDANNARNRDLYLKQELKNKLLFYGLRPNPGEKEDE